MAFELELECACGRELVMNERRVNGRTVYKADECECMEEMAQQVEDLQSEVDELQAEVKSLSSQG
jgi:hypothetical protein